MHMQRQRTLHLVLNLNVLPIVDTVLSGRMSVFVLKAHNGEFLIQLELSVASSTVMCGAVPMKVFGLLALFLAVVSIVIEHDQMFP